MMKYVVMVKPVVVWYIRALQKDWPSLFMAQHVIQTRNVSAVSIPS